MVNKFKHFQPPTRRSSLATSLVVALTATGASATTLTVDLSSAIGPAQHVASGSLYGVTETLPADVDGLINPLHPRMFTNPAADVQQPVGDAIVVAGRVAASGATVTIRLADWLKGFYTFTSMSDWLDKVAQTVSRRKAANLANIYGYEIWNEPAGTWSKSNPVSFNDFWKQTFVRLRELDPEIKIIGPSYAWYDQSSLSGFLSFCKSNGCVPDIVSWHELGGGNVTANVQSYRALEKQLGVGPLPISINEYSGAAHIDVEGQPGASAPLIAKFERAQVDSACISYWDVSHAGRLGSLLATNTQPNGGWWFYKWYGEMSGNMVATTPPSPTNATALDGFANLDAKNARASVLLGGTNDGTIQILVKGFAAAAVFGTRVHAVVERTPFMNRTTIVNATSTLSSDDISVTNDQISVSISGANATDGYRLTLQPVGGGGSAGTGGASNNGGTAGATANGGSSGRTNAEGGGLASGGAMSTGGSANGAGADAGGTNAGGMSSGGAHTAGAFSSGTGGVAGASGSNAQGGSVARGGASAANGGASPSAGESSMGARSGASGAPAFAGNTEPTPAGADASSGCSCRLPAAAPSPFSGSAGLALAIAGLARARRSRRRHAGRAPLPT